MSDFAKVVDATSYTVHQHLADPNAHPQYVKNDASIIAGVLDTYLETHPIEVMGNLDQLENVVITAVADGDLLTYDATEGKWVNKPTANIGLQDVTLNGTSLVNSAKVAVIPNASTQTYGAIRLATAVDVRGGSSTEVAVSPANVTTMITNYKNTATSTVTVQISSRDEDGVLAGSPKWRIDQGSWNDSGAVVYNVEPGTHEIEFNSVTGYTTPPDLSVEVIGGVALSWTQEYIPSTGKITVSIMPVAAQTNGRWYTDEDPTERLSGATLEVNNGARKIYLKSIDSYNSAEPLDFGISGGQNMSLTMVYPDLSSEVSATIVNITSATVPHWRLDTDPAGTYPYVSGQIVKGVMGTRTVSFEPITGYVTPQPQVITAVKDGKLHVVASYQESSEMIYGVRYLKGTGHPSPKLTGVIMDRHTGAKHFLGESEPWPDLPVHNQFKKCLVDTATASVNYYLDPVNSGRKADGGDSDLTGNDGEVMVEYPLVYFRVDYMGIDTTTNCEIYDWLISLTPFQGATLHPYFYVHADDTHAGEPHVQYLGAYESVAATMVNGVKGPGVATAKWEHVKRNTEYAVNDAAIVEDASVKALAGALRCIVAGTTANDDILIPASPAINTEFQDGTVTWRIISAANIQSPVAYNATTRCARSIAGFKPQTNLTLAQFRTEHTNAGLHTMNSLAMQFLALMMFIEYRTLDSQDSGTVNYDTDRGCAGNRSDGFVWFNDSFAYLYTRETGRADMFGNGTGEVLYDVEVDTDLIDNFSSSATGHKKVVGFTYRGLENPFGHVFKFEDGILTDVDGYWWTNQADKYTSDLAVAKTRYTQVLHTWPGSGYIKFFTMTQEEPSFFATTTGGSSTTYLPDYFLWYASPGLRGQTIQTYPSLNYPSPKTSGISGAKIDVHQQGRVTTGSRSAFSIPYSV